MYMFVCTLISINLHTLVTATEFNIENTQIDNANEQFFFCVSKFVSCLREVSQPKKGHVTFLKMNDQVILVFPQDICGYI